MKMSKNVAPDAISRIAVLKCSKCNSIIVVTADEDSEESVSGHRTDCCAASGTLEVAGVIDLMP